VSRARTGREIIFETIQRGQSLKISAIDASTGVEVSIIAPLTASEMQTQGIAARKLEQKLIREGIISVGRRNEKPGSKGFLV
jgi:hypothetical protein